MALTDQLTAYYKFNSNANDSVGSNNGTEVNTPTYTTGNGSLGDCMSLASASSQYVTLPNGVFPWGTNTVTVNMWVNVASTAANQGVFMVARTSQGAMMYFSAAGWDFAKPNVVSLTYSFTGDSAWHMWTFVADGSGMRYYKDGNSTPVASNANTAVFSDPSGDTIPVGAYRSGGSIQSGWYLNGKIQALGVWSRALSTSEISQLYASGSGLQYPFSASSSIKTVDGLAIASVKTVNGLAIASVKNINGLA